MPNKLSQFWQELKRRNVVRVITVYAGAAFVLLELVDMITEPFGLPAWTFNLAVLILSLGFVVAIILSWIYDIHPEGGMVKTEPADKVKAEDIPKSSSGWKIASYISFVVIVGLIVLNVVPRNSKEPVSEVLDKSIAVLPFRNDSPEQERMYFINGTMESILNNLSKIEDLRVISRNSVEQYRDNPRPTPVVAEEMNVSYILEGSGHRDGDNVRLFVQLLDGRKDQHLWSKSYDANIDEIFAMQSDIAQLVATEINAIITPEEQKLISKVPTNDLTAYDLFQRGMEDYWKYQINNDNISDLVKAKEFYHRALAHDSTFAFAYTGLAWIYWEVEREGYNLYQESYFSEDFLDSILILADRALSCDPQLSDAYTIRGLYYWETGESEKAAAEFEKALDLNPNDWMAYRMKGDLYFLNDPLVSIQSYHNALLLYRGSEIPKILGDLSDAYTSAGFVDEAKRIDRERLELDGDSVKYLSSLSLITKFEGKFTEANGYIINAYRLDTNNITSLSRLSWSYLDLHKYREALDYYEKYIQRMKSLATVDLDGMNRIGYAYWNNGLREEADYYFGKQIEYCKRSIELGRVYSQTKLAHYDLAGVYAFLGNKEKAYEYLKILNQAKIINFYMKSLLRFDPLFDNIRDESEFQQIVRDVEAKYQEEHERVRQWLEENEML